MTIVMVCVIDSRLERKNCNFGHTFRLEQDEGRLTHYETEKGRNGDCTTTTTMHAEK